MARINFHDDIESNNEFWKLLEINAGDRYRTLGKLVAFFRIAQEAWANDRPMTQELLSKHGLDEMINSGWAIEVVGGYQSKEAERYFGWYRQKVQASIAGGKARSKGQRDEFGRFISTAATSRNPAGIQPEPAGVQPPSPSPSPFLYKETPSLRSGGVGGDSLKSLRERHSEKDVDDCLKLLEREGTSTGAPVHNPQAYLTKMMEPTLRRVEERRQVDAQKKKNAEIEALRSAEMASEKEANRLERLNGQRVTYAQHMARMH